MLLYLHGLNSGGGSAKAALLRQALYPLEVLSPTYPAHLADEAVAVLSGVLSDALGEARRRDEPLLLVGSSMGGFYGQYLARRFPVDHLVMINPALRPWDLLKQVVGWQHNEALGERYYLSERMVEATRRFGLGDVADGVPTTLLLDRGDELIDWRIAESIYSGHAEIHAFPEGSHAFDHMDEAVAIIRRLHQALSCSSAS
jgi:predicted esterase YcpF (UPF0227 family)